MMRNLKKVCFIKITNNKIISFKLVKNNYNFID